MRRRFQQKVQFWAVGLVLLMICTGCASIPSESPEPDASTIPYGVAPKFPAKNKAGAPQEVSYYVHTVKWPGESVSIIAAWYTGDLKNWEALAKANPNINPNRIFEGNKILIPENMLKTRIPMPKDFVDSFYPKPPSKPAPQPTREEEPELFGPKQYPRN
jgi:hypothetical protein